MFARALSKVARVARPVAIQRPSFRCFSDVLDIPTDKEQQWGRRKEELDAEAKGEIGFDHLASIVPAADAGTKENPILVSFAFSVKKTQFSFLLISSRLHLITATLSSLYMPRYD
jgi:hypothetical protein